MKKIAVVGSNGLPANYGGWETLTEYLVEYLASRFMFTVFCSTYSHADQIDKYKGAKLEYLRLRANGVQSILYDIVSMWKARNTHDIILVLGVSGGLFLPFIKPFSSAKFIVNIDGLEWKRAKWNRFIKFYLKLSERVAVKSADRIIGDNEIIRQYISTRYKRDSFYLSYGGDHVSASNIDPGALTAYVNSTEKFAFKVCRIEPENNVEMILEAYINSERRFKLIIVGNWANSRYGLELRQKYDDFRNVILLDPIYDLKKLDAFRSRALVYLHGHSAGGTNPSLVEAMNLSLPIFAFRCDFNIETTKNGCDYFRNSAELDVLFDRIEGDNEWLVKNGKKMEEIAEEFYRWKIIAFGYKSLFELE